MTESRPAATPKLRRTVALGSLLLFAAVTLGRVELVALAAPLLALAAAGVAATKTPRFSASLRLSSDRCLQGDAFTATVVVEASEGCEDLDIGVMVPSAFELEGSSGRAALSLRTGERHSFELKLRARRWGAHRLGVIVARGYGPGRLLEFRSVHDVRRIVRVYPAMETVRSAIAPPKTQVFAGNYVAPVTGAGIEFADVREFNRGDRIRQVNWRVSSRRPDIYVNVNHPERNSDIVIFLDSFADVGPPARSSLDLTVRAAAMLARRYLSHRDRVGLVSFGGMLKWLTGSMGERQFYRIIEYLLDAQTSLSYAWKGIDVLPTRTLPPLSLVVALSPLIDERTLAALDDLRARGFAVAAIDTLAEDDVAPGPGIEGRIAHRAWRLQRAAVRFELARAGIPVTQWTGREPFEAALVRFPRSPHQMIGARP
ncbi:MAG: DUF58 domain-containing protein [Actinomycetota bacterium]